MPAAADRFGSLFGSGRRGSPPDGARDAITDPVLLLDSGRTLVRWVGEGRPLHHHGLIAAHPVVELYRDPPGAPYCWPDRYGTLLRHESADLIFRWYSTGQRWYTHLNVPAVEYERLMDWLTARAAAAGR